MRGGRVSTLLQPTTVAILLLLFLPKETHDGTGLMGLSLDTLYSIMTTTQVLGTEDGGIHNTIIQLYVPDRKQTRPLVPNGILLLGLLPNPPDNQQRSLTPAEGGRQKIKDLQELGV
ncbi:hypothetical protein HGM15179_012139 [Zosterops borbonicus]|uniref:Uncharacterized protein n=1 Tax=Zosterops borbonicus TaxID=364589 RepID=A0A8K1GBA2_9PASS|nr:hypothetical protein HGM15179_012139 [Zosterops borbonicus]